MTAPGDGSGRFVPLFEQAVSDPGGVAIFGSGGNVTWAEAAEVSARIAATLKDLDLGPERRVAVFARNRPATVLAHLGALLAGSSVAALSAALTVPEVAYQIEEADARIVFADSGTEKVARTVVRSRPLTRLVVLPEASARGGDIDSWAAAEARSPRPGDDVRPNLLFTSGTTGRPKAVKVPPATHGTGADLAGFVAHATSNRMSGLGPHLVAGPLHHNGPLTSVRLLLAGNALVVLPKFSATAFLEAVARQRVASSVMVPTHFVRLLALPPEERAASDVSSLRCVVHTGAACPPEIKRAILDWWGPVLYESYGGTESGTVCSIGPEDWLAHPGSVGRAVPPFEALVVDTEGRPTPAGEEGLLYFRDTTGRGIRYEGDEAKTAAVHLAPGVFTLGEIGRIDANGFVYITDRCSDMVLSGGVNVYPAEAEQVLMQHPAVLDAAGFGVPDPDLGEHLAAAVVLRGGASVDGDELLLFCRDRLAGYKLPKEIHLLPGLARNEIGKLDKQALRARFSRTPA